MVKQVRLPGPSAPRLSIVIPTFNGRPVLADCLASVRAYRPVDSEVIVVDDGSTDGTSEWLRAVYPEVRLVRQETNQGFCKAINAGIRAARAPVIETLNNDTVVMPHWAEYALELFDDPTVGSVAPLVWLMHAEGLIDSAGDEYHLSGWAMNRGHRMRPGPALLQVKEVFGACACAAFFRSEALVAAGGFPDHFGAYYDDVDLAFRLRRVGYRCVYTPSAQVVHHLHHSYDHDDPAVVTQTSLNEERVFWANLPAGLLRRGVLPHVAYIVCNAFGRLLRRRHCFAYLKGKLLALGECRAIRAERKRRRRLARQAIFPVHLPVLTGGDLLLGRIRRGLAALFC